MKLNLDVSKNLPAIMADETYLGDAIGRLLDNAIKFSPDGGRITVAVEDVGEMVQVSVSDEGVGIPKDQHKRIFERFYQVDGSARRRFAGVGLGLTIAKRIVEAHRGEIWVESEPGEGSTFYFKIPKYQADARQAGGQEPSTEERAS